MGLKGNACFAAEFDDGRVLYIYQNPSVIDSKKDNLEAWLNENTFGGLYTREFHGHGGIYCLLKISEEEIGKISEIERKIEKNPQGGVKRPYRHIVQVTYQPNQKGIPSELVEGLEGIGYKEIQIQEK